jgi:6-phosphofructokinase 1
VNLLVLQGGGPTPVLNASLFGILDEARRSPRIARTLGSRFGVQGLLHADFLDLSSLPQPELQRLRHTPGASLGTTRYKPSEQELERIIHNLRQHDIRYLILIGGNGSQRGAHAIDQAARRLGYELFVIGVPKTIDNDIPATDRCPGYASAARYLAQSVRDLGMDVRSLPQPVSIYETMGRDVGWLAAASALGKLDEQHAPHLIYLPERPFDTARFLADIDRTIRKLGWAVAVVSEGLKTATGQPVYENTSASQRDALNRPLPGGVGNYLAEVVTRELNIRCRTEKPGLCGRSSMLHVSPQDQADAELVARAALRAALEEKTGLMVSLRPLGGEKPYELIPLSTVAGDRHIPPEWLDNSDLSVGPSFIKYIRPLVGDLVDYAVPLMDRAACRVGTAHLPRQSVGGAHPT